MMHKLALTLMLSTSWAVFADDDDALDPQPCKFTAYTAVGTVSGQCTTEDMPTPGYNSRWKLTLIFDAQSEPLARGLKPDQFCDMMRAQSTAKGVDNVVLPLWGNLRIIPLNPEYFDQVKKTAPIYETTPNLVTIRQTGDSPYTLEMTFEEPEEYFNPALKMPSAEWWGQFLESYYRLGTNRTSGFSVDGRSPISHPASKAQARSSN